MVFEKFYGFQKENESKTIFAKVYIRSGSFYLITKKSFLKYKSLVGKKCVGIELFDDEKINIDTEDDLEYLKYRLKC